jgi:hypothetical protein
MKDTIFKSTQTMPPTANSPDVVRTAMSPGDVVNTSITEGGLRLSRSPAALRDGNYDVKNVQRPVRGRPY